MNPKLPYYMAYPMPLAYDDEKIERRDYEYMKSLYPSTAKKVLPYVEDECDRMEYQCSMMYDEYPDKLQLRMMCNRIYENVLKHEKIFYGDGFENMFGKDEVEDQAIRFPGRLPKQGRPPEGERPPMPGRPPEGERPPKPGRPPQNRPPQGNPNWLRELIDVMLYQELYKRRSDNRRSSRKFY